MRILLAIALVSVATAAVAGWDPGGNTPPNAWAINRAAGAHQPIEPRADTTREGMIHATGNGGGM